MRSDLDFKITQAMVKFGGGFVSLLGKAAQCADDNNLERLKNAFPEYWEQYSDPAYHQNP